MKTTIYMGLSLDGFAARPDDGLDFLPAPPDGDDGGFSAFLATVDVILMGRRTFEVVRSFDGWPYGQTRVIVLSTTDPAALLEGAPPTVSVRAGEPAALLQALEAEGVGHVYVDGPATARRFLELGLIDVLQVTFVPVLIGQGIGLWGPLAADVKLELLGSRALPGGMVECRYSVLRGASTGEGA
jgi:dihydrofolate reductase